ncbi:hypothetical protein Syun_002853 [Stephania yunnanensis]|uniref:Uncharacterized protein n=1 Tax=Stephania yunnanensis TaxID=152371 RepID=A0AAP0Q397_9MAGN
MAASKRRTGEEMHHHRRAGSNGAPARPRTVGGQRRRQAEGGADDGLRDRAGDDGEEARLRRRGGGGRRDDAASGGRPRGRWRRGRSGAGGQRGGCAMDEPDGARRGAGWLDSAILRGGGDKKTAAFRQRAEDLRWLATPARAEMAAPARLGRLGMSTWTSRPRHPCDDLDMTRG